jgi:hypothetical protein
MEFLVRPVSYLSLESYPLRYHSTWATYFPSEDGNQGRRFFLSSIEPTALLPVCNVFATVRKSPWSACLVPFFDMLADSSAVRESWIFLRCVLCSKSSITHESPSIRMLTYKFPQAFFLHGAAAFMFRRILTWMPVMGHTVVRNHKCIPAALKTKNSECPWRGHVRSSGYVHM